MRTLDLRTAPAVEAEGYAATLAPWVHAASNPFADWYFGAPEVAAEILGEWMRRPTAEVYVGRALLAWEDGSERPAGCLIALSGAELARCRAADFAALCEEMGDADEAAATLEEVTSAARTLFPPVPDDALYISRVAVDPDRRGRGLGRALVAHAISLHRAQGFQRFRLDVSADNAPALRAYAATGLHVTTTSTHPPSGLNYCAMEL